MSTHQVARMLKKSAAMFTRSATIHANALALLSKATAAEAGGAPGKKAAPAKKGEAKLTVAERREAKAAASAKSERQHSKPAKKAAPGKKAAPAKKAGKKEAPVAKKGPPAKKAAAGKKASATPAKKAKAVQDDDFPEL